MWKKYRIFVLLLIVVITIFSLSFIKEKEDDSLLLIGDISHVKEHLIDKLDDYNIVDFTLSAMKSKELLFYLTNNVKLSNEEGTKTINNLIKESKYIVLSIGINDIFSKITINKYEKTILYDKENMNLTFEVLEQNILEIIKHINNINKSVRLLMTSYDDPFYFLKNDDENDKLINDLNSLMNSICLKFNQYFLELSLGSSVYYDDEFCLYPNSLAKAKIAENIYQKIIAIND